MKITKYITHTVWTTSQGENIWAASPLILYDVWSQKQEQQQWECSLRLQ